MCSRYSLAALPETGLGLASRPKGLAGTAGQGPAATPPQLTPPPSGTPADWQHPLPANIQSQSGAQRTTPMSSATAWELAGTALKYGLWWLIRCLSQPQRYSMYICGHHCRLSMLKAEVSVASWGHCCKRVRVISRQEGLTWTAWDGQQYQQSPCYPFNRVLMSTPQRR